MRLLPDAIVLGDQYGKLARALAFAANAKVTLGDSEPCDRVIATGARCLESGLLIQKHQLWIAPPIPTQDQLVAIKASSQPMQVLIPGIDEDGRSSWWRAHAPVQAQIITLDGVGNRVDWAWERILEVVKK